MSGRLLASCLAVMAASACAPREQGASGEASGSFDCEIFQPGANPPNWGDAVVRVTFDGDERVLAQGAAAFAIDGEGSQTLDPAEASYFALQAYQEVSPSVVEVFEIRVLPASWAPGIVEIDGASAVALLGEVEYDGNGSVVEARIVAESRSGRLRLDAAGDEPREAVLGSVMDLRLSSN